ncbi:zinc transporter ZntB [Rhodospirillum rubrum]|uniref:CorA family divalent cation transporter n=1 Tax=Rhodospirillum rubrum TaxID=1085 RepID=UPI001903AC14|nr:CorA family divalent cation transporter [Rhodospirillum rubrum]MBK1664024.1 zinc transporter ZntB [Rhodospirillum rubrum]MBK1675418.1 zinc transporter ZntB [Rhodospirillum rubrum]
MVYRKDDDKDATAPPTGAEAPDLLWIVALDGKGGCREVALDDVPALIGGPERLWVHLHRGWPKANRWLKEVLAIPRPARRDLLAESTRPDSAFLGEGVLLNMRGINVNPGADPEDMVSLRLWITPTLIITSRARFILAAKDVRAQLAQSQGPVDCGGVAAALALGLAERMQPFLLELEDAIYALDERDEELRENNPLVEEEIEEALHQSRIDIVGLRRYLAPQQAALTRLMGHPHPALCAQDRDILGAALATFTRYVEDLDSLREQAALLRDRIQQRAQQRMNRAIYKMTLLAGIFLPLTFVTGLLGVNLGGLPGAQSPFGFWILVGLLIALAIGEFLYIRHSRRL